MTSGRIGVVSAGECMIELVELGDGLMRRSFGGDTLNTAVYLRRSLDPARYDVSYLTVLGDDPFSDEMVDAWQAEGLDCSMVGRLGDRLPGLHAVRTDERGDRSFYYWRDRAPVRDLFSDVSLAPLLDASRSAGLFYFSGITLAILDEESREKLVEDLALRRRNGVRVAHDPNFRPRLWPDRERARYWQKAIYAHCDVVLPTFDDEQALWGDDDPAGTIARLRDSGVGEIVVKCGGDAAHVWTDAAQTSLAPLRTVDPVDTTGAGDSFNAAYLAARLEGESLEQALADGHALAGHVVMHKGAIAPRIV
ncbi:MAG: sugar kinase [Geminicoccaceae bacterium]|nr:sugar kinase [Geminicoccaceae bacterium]MCB9944409.1 sugar kinase [Geminicoccaceae bacterium]